MTLNLTIQKTSHTDFTPRITVIGVGGGGTNAVNNMIALNLPGVDFVVANTDAQQLLLSRAERRIQLGPHITQGNGAGGRPEVGKASAEEAAEDLARHLDGAHMVFITAGMGGGTGTGAAPVIARMARERGILTVGVVTKPFSFEGRRRLKSADEGITELQNYVDTLIVIPNQNLFKVANERTGWKEAFEMADHVLYMGVRGVTDLMVVPGMVNLDYADIRSVMSEMGKAMMGTGEAEGEDRAIRAAEAAISNPLLEDTNMKGARGLLINITGGSDLTLFELDQAANRIREEVDEDANIMVGMALDENLGGRVRISVVATGIDSAAPAQSERPKLVAMGGGGMMADAVATTHAGATHQPPVLNVVPAQPMSPHSQPQPQHHQPQPMQPQAPQFAAHASQPQTMTQAMPQAEPPMRAPISAPAAYRDAPRNPAEPARKASLFSRMTNGFRGAVAPQPMANEYQRPEAQAQTYAMPQEAAPQHYQAPAPQAAPAQYAAPAPHAQPAPIQQGEPRPAVRLAHNEEIGIDIPAFLRRQQS
ncbi:cell division protein FtsZ [Acidiphilium acidophilum]|uniref:Cell division protein FtsZ n=1 Tax=Acidiphilium acidophilum TaxID=76588 RepID=A0AAW9DSL5_ACIAO|nr:cell division protein FtsZ [Acidiphilium acidophilum]MDX5932079.1 cell division protein FtsZ [Acidiphilium acidophilum]GBQ05335.1 cell division protein FtsZ [Acidiphilium acidophilum DSM 700]